MLHAHFDADEMSYAAPDEVLPFLRNTVTSPRDRRESAPPAIMVALHNILRLGHG
jgi:hypothetical protein